MVALRHILPAVICLAGVIVIVVTGTTRGLEGGLMLVGAGLSVWLLNWTYRFGASGDRERGLEEAQRGFLDEHGRWPTAAEREHWVEHGEWPARG